jgi:hypothetical protein
LKLGKTVVWYTTLQNVEIMDVEAPSVFWSTNHSPIHKADASFIPFIVFPFPKKVASEFVDFLDEPFREGKNSRVVCDYGCQRRVYQQTLAALDINVPFQLGSLLPTLSSRGR